MSDKKTIDLNQVFALVDADEAVIADPNTGQLQIFHDFEKAMETVIMYEKGGMFLDIMKVTINPVVGKYGVIC